MKKKTDRIPKQTIGKILREEFLAPLGITAYRLAKDIGTSTTTILEILNGKRASGWSEGTAALGSFICNY